MMPCDYLLFEHLTHDHLNVHDQLVLHMGG